MVRWMRGTFEFDNPYKQTESKMQSNREDFDKKKRIKPVELWDCSDK